MRKRRSDRGLGVIGGRRSGAVLALVGPPGVGKTSLGESVARAMDRKFVRVALGGVRDEAEIRGHRRTYVGALPGRIVRAIREAGTMNPVVLLDEVDKIGADYRGDPAAALLEVLDPAQNHTFRDHYLEVDLDLSDVVFLATANVLDSIPGPLLDRMELVTLDGYTEDEKVAIGRDHLLPRQLDKAGLSADEVTHRRRRAPADRGRVHPRGGRPVARAGHRPGAAEGRGQGGPRAGRASRSRSASANLRDYLGRPRFTPETRLTSSDRRTAVPGVATGLAVTGAGGDVLYIEASLADAETGGTGVTLTGQLGDVMKESAQIALSYLRSHGAELELPVTDLKDRGVHVHVPAGAVPKDGPSAGVTMTTALASLLSGRPVRSDVAMTGEVSLTGRVLPIGGREAEAARRAPGGHHHGADPAAERARPGRRARRGAGEADGAPDERRAGRAGAGPRARVIGRQRRRRGQRGGHRRRVGPKFGSVSGNGRAAQCGPPGRCRSQSKRKSVDRTDRCSAWLAAPGSDARRRSGRGRGRTARPCG